MIYVSEKHGKINHFPSNQQGFQHVFAFYVLQITCEENYNNNI